MPQHLDNKSRGRAETLLECDNSRQSSQESGSNNDFLRIIYQEHRPVQRSGEDGMVRSPSVQFRDNPSDDTILGAFRMAEQESAGERLDDFSLKTALQKMREGPSNYGFFDLGNPQHRELLYYHLSNLHIARDVSLSNQKKTSEEYREWQKEKMQSPDVQHTYKTAYLGAGASIAYYIESLGKSVDHRDSIVISMPQPWGGERGPGQLVHPEHLITPKRQFSGETEINDRWTDRAHFSQLLEDIFQESGIKREQQPITKVEETERFYRLTSGEKDRQQTLYAKEVIVGLGAGQHALRGLEKNQVAQTKEDVEMGRKRMMNMDIFTHVADTLEPAEKREGTVIILVGGNGLTGSVFRALDKGYRVKWITGDTGPTFIPGQLQDALRLPYLKYLSSVEANPDQKQKYDQERKHLENSSLLKDLYRGQDQKYQGVEKRFKQKFFDQIHFASLKNAEQTGNRVVARLNDGGEVTGDYLVYAMGQDLRPFRIFDENILQNLELNADKNQRFQQRENEAIPTTLGLKTKDDPTGKSLKIVGAAAARFASRVDANHTMNSVFKTLPDNAAFTDVLTPIRSSIEASNNFMPYDIHEHIDYSTADRTMLAAHLSAKFPTIADTKQTQTEKGKRESLRSSKPFVERLTEKIIQSRKQRNIKDASPGSVLPQGPDVLPIPPHGKQFQKHWEQSLQHFEDRLKSQIQKEKEKREEV